MPKASFVWCNQVEANENGEVPHTRDGKGRHHNRRSKDGKVVISFEVDKCTISTVSEAEESRPVKEKKFMSGIYRWPGAR
jgi:hypothetical protein